MTPCFAGDVYIFCFVYIRSMSGVSKYTLYYYYDILQLYSKKCSITAGLSESLVIRNNQRRWKIQHRRIKHMHSGDRQDTDVDTTINIVGLNADRLCWYLHLWWIIIRTNIDVSFIAVGWYTQLMLMSASSMPDRFPVQWWIAARSNSDAIVMITIAPPDGMLIRSRFQISEVNTHDYHQQRPKLAVINFM